MRIISHNFNPQKFEETSRFSSIFPAFLNDLNLNQYVDLLRIWENLRNTIHNNGVFNPPNGRDQIIVYRNQKFIFENGKQHPLTSWEMLIALVADLCEMMDSIVKSNEISSIQEILDPSTAQIR